MIPLVLVTVFFLAAGLMVVGLRGRQVGDEPRCQVCLYDLSGSSETCPECGTAFSLHTTRRGLKKIRFAFVTGGLLLFASEIAFLNATYDRARWLRHFPYSILLAYSKNAPLDHVLFTEMSRRYRAGELTPSQLARTIEVGLDAYDIAISKPRGTVLELILWSLYFDQSLTDDQEARFRDLFNIPAMEAFLEGNCSLQ